MDKTILATVAAAAFLAATPARADTGDCASSANLLVNCSFEVGYADGWLLAAADGTAGVIGSDEVSFPIGPHSGDAMFWSSTPVDVPAYLAQTVATTPHATYDISLWVAEDELGGLASRNVVDVWFDGVQVGGLTNVVLGNFRQYRFSGVASGTSASFQLYIGNDVGRTYLDDVSIIPVPEPAPALLLALGLPAALALARRRRR